MFFHGFEKRIAKLIGMEDFSAADGKFVSEQSSDYPAYTFKLTARDLVRFGWLYLNRGACSGARIVPADWVDESTKPWSVYVHAGSLLHGSAGPSGLSLAQGQA